MKRGADDIQPQLRDGSPSLDTESNNSWFQYQRLVLQQIQDHGVLLQALDKEINDIKEKRAAQIADFLAWKETIETQIKELKTKCSFILYDEKGPNHIIRQLQQKITVDEAASTKIKAVWAVYGAIAVFIINVILQLFNLFKN